MRKSAIFIAGILLFYFSGLAMASEVSLVEARVAAENWLHHCIRAYGAWGGSDAPAITGEEVMEYNNQIVGYNFLVSPVGNIVVPARDELPPVKLYSDTSTLSTAEDTDLAQWIQEELYKLDEALDTHAEKLAAIDLAETHNGKLWALYEKNLALFAQEYGKATVKGPSAILQTSGSESLSLGPLLATTWGQGDPYNDNCPTGDTSCGTCPGGGTPASPTLVGCVATAAAQIMNYWQLPSSGTGSHSYTWLGDDSCGGSTPSQTLSATFSDSYDWANMLNSYSGGETVAQKAAVAELCYEAGVAWEMDYGVCGSGANTMYGATVYPTYFGYDSSTIAAVYRTSYGSDSAWMQVFRNEVQAGRPSHFRISTGTSGHSVVVDGYRDSPSEQIHINMGWYGNYNGWYVSNNIVTGSYSWTDVNYQAAVVGIQPVGSGDSILHKAGATWWSGAGGWWNVATPYTPGGDWARDEESYGSERVILHKAGATWWSSTGWNLNPPYTPGFDWAVDFEFDPNSAPSHVILHKTGAFWKSWSIPQWYTGTPYTPGVDWARDLEYDPTGTCNARILHKCGATWIDGGTDWDTSSPYTPGTDWAVDSEFDPYYPCDFLILHKAGAVWMSWRGWETGEPYIAGSDWARDVEIPFYWCYYILHKCGAMWNSVNGWDHDPPYTPGVDWAVDSEFALAF